MLSSPFWSQKAVALEGFSADSVFQLLLYIECIVFGIPHHASEG